MDICLLDELRNEENEILKKLSEFKIYERKIGYRRTHKDLIIYCVKNNLPYEEYFLKEKVYDIALSHDQNQEQNNTKEHLKLFKSLFICICTQKQFLHLPYNSDILYDYLRQKNISYPYTMFNIK